jgi:hypothetical protein
VAGGAGELADHLVQGGDQSGQGVGAAGFAQDGSVVLVIWVSW